MAEKIKLDEPRIFSILEKTAYADPAGFVHALDDTLKVTKGSFFAVKMNPMLIKIISNCPEVYVHMLYTKDFADPDLLNQANLSVIKDGQELQLKDSEITADVSDYRLLTMKRILVKINDPTANPREIAANDNKFFRFATEKIQDPAVKGRVSLENTLKISALAEVYAINSMHEAPDIVRFASTENIAPKELYSLLVYGEEEVFTSTFSECFYAIQYYFLCFPASQLFSSFF
jgi:hypothetical protein